MVDDEVSVLNPCVTMMRNFGYDIYGAKNSKEALGFLSEHKPDILILDINLREEVDGFMLLKKGIELNPKAYGIILTGGDTSLRECLQRGAKALFTKPVNLDKMLSAIDEIIKKIG